MNNSIKIERACFYSILRVDKYYTSFGYKLSLNSLLKNRESVKQCVVMAGPWNSLQRLSFRCIGKIWQFPSIRIRSEFKYGIAIPQKGKNFICKPGWGCLAALAMRTIKIPLHMWLYYPTCMQSLLYVVPESLATLTGEHFALDKVMF